MFAFDSWARRYFKFFLPVENRLDHKLLTQRLTNFGCIFRNFFSTDACLEFYKGNPDGRSKTSAIFLLQSLPNLFWICEANDSCTKTRLPDAKTNSTLAQSEIRYCLPGIFKPQCFPNGTLASRQYSPNKPATLTERNSTRQCPYTPCLVGAYRVQSSTTQ